MNVCCSEFVTEERLIPDVALQICYVVQSISYFS